MMLGVFPYTHRSVRRQR